MRPRPLAVLALSAAILAAAARPAAARLRIVATVPDLAAIARAVAGPGAEVTSLALPTQDPHYVDARPHLALRLNRADLLLVVGLKLEVGWLPVLLRGARNPRIQRGAPGYLDCSTVVRLRDVPRAKIDRSMGDIHPGGNPHYLLDPENAVRVARAVAERLEAIAGGKGGAYRARASAFARAVRAAVARWRKRLAPHRGAPVVTYHRSWIYFVHFAGLKLAGHLEPKPGIPPSAAHLLRLMRRMRAEKVRLVLQEAYYPSRTARVVAKKTGARLLVLPGGANVRKGEGYVARLGRLVDAVARALGGGAAPGKARRGRGR